MIVVAFITYLLVIIGDLVPKTIGLRNLEKYAILFAPLVLITNKLCMEEYHFEIVDMDGVRVDKVLAKNIAVSQ